MDLWDYLTIEEYTSDNFVTKYEDRFYALCSIINSYNSNKIQVIEHKVVSNLKEALEFTSEMMSCGFEGAVLKDYSMLFKNGTSKHQLKLKLEIDTTMRIKDFLPGNKGSKNEAYFSAITFENDEGTIKGQVGVTSLTEALRDELFAKRHELIGTLMDVKFNDLSKADGHDYYALSHPRFLKLRNDITDTDTLEKVFKLREMAMEMKHD